MDSSDSFDVNPEANTGDAQAIERRGLLLNSTYTPTRDRPWMEKFSIAVTILQLGLSLTELLIASLWLHMAGIIISAIAFLLSVAGGFIWYHRLLFGERKLVKYCIRPLARLVFCLLSELFPQFALVRFLGIGVLVGLIVVGFALLSFS